MVINQIQTKNTLSRDPIANSSNRGEKFLLHRHCPLRRYISTLPANPERDRKRSNLRRLRQPKIRRRRPVASDIRRNRFELVSVYCSFDCGVSSLNERKMKFRIDKMKLMYGSEKLDWMEVHCLMLNQAPLDQYHLVMKFPYPGALTALQYFTSAVGVLICGWLKLVEHDKLDLLTMWQFLPAAVIFYLSLFTNSELLLHANVDTFIVFRSAVPIFVAIGETLYLHQPWPALKTWFSLATIFAGSVLYVITDYQFTLTAYSWALAYLVSMSIDLFTSSMSS
ncbi:GDP-mannose transporter GONST3 [Sesamum angolense]|uniref:GDP-mannose transporter GONST3 n=1 Tax=Sesamum angolense TaxID=2727404 RepID=A0AAE1X1G2_9LAMI|nr:GDP-mannose transporter GONST3 [Sesamum angolense]